MDDSVITCDKVIESLQQRNKNYSNKFLWKESNL